MRMNWGWGGSFKKQTAQSATVGAEQNACSLIGSSPFLLRKSPQQLGMYVFNCSLQARSDDIIVASSTLFSGGKRPKNLFVGSGKSEIFPKRSIMNVIFKSGTVRLTD